MMNEQNIEIKLPSVSECEVKELIEDLELMILIFENLNPKPDEWTIAYTLNRKIFVERKDAYHGKEEINSK